MKKIESFEFVKEYLKEGAILTTDLKNRFAFRNEKVICQRDGSSYKLKMDDFIITHHKETFYLVEDDDVYIDDNKDEDYYRYFKK